LVLLLLGFKAFMMETEAASQQWDSTLDSASVLRDFSPQAAGEVCAMLEAHPVFKTMNDPQAIEAITLEPKVMPSFIEDISALRDEVQHGRHFVVTRPIEGLSLERQMAVPWLMGQALGRILAQNELGHRYYIVADRGGRMEEGARYSQTSQGGSFHTDGVNLKEGYEYFLLHCAAPAAEGGESVLLDGRTVFHDLRENAPQELEILQMDFAWEYKGIRPGEFYREPILRLVGGKPQWRYLRDYIEEAACLRGEPLDEVFSGALDRLDESLANPSFQFHCKLQAGQTAIINDRAIFHGRRPFRDGPGTVSIEERLSSSRCASLKRTYCRLWVDP